MPNRVLRDWTMSEKIQQISVHAERFFTRLMMKVDDYGRFFSDPRLLKANLFPLQLDSIRETDLTRWMSECQKAGLIVIYEINTKGYLQIEDFGQTLRQKREKFPGPQSATHLLSNCVPETETKPKLETNPKHITKIGPDRFNKKLSDVLSNEYRYLLESHLMSRLKGCSEADVLRTMDLEYPNYEFNDANHLGNALKGIKDKIQPAGTGQKKNQLIK